ncbi:MAG: NADH-quinone oxidoreductase subunit N, partial [Isosphaeraceae bacterium]
PRRTWSIASALTMLGALTILLAQRSLLTDAYSAVALNDPLSFYARLVLLLAGLILLGLAHDQVDDARAAEFFGALLMIHAGSMLIAASNELVFLFVGLELVSIPTYLILYLPRRNVTTLEAATTYFYLSIFSSALFLYGMAYLYGLTGVSNLKALSYLIHESHIRYIPQAQFGLIAAVFLMAGLGFRVAAVPFHFYAPDVYQGSPTVVAALMSWVPKAIGFVAILRCLTAVLGGDNPVAQHAITLCWVIAVVSMVLGNTVALIQEDLKRLLAYSSISHAGYLMIGVTVAFANGPNITAAYLGGQGILFYLTAYSLMTLGAFGVIIALDTPERPVRTVSDLAGLGRTNPLMAFAMALCLFSLAGVPPMAGFFGKFTIFASALTASTGENGSMFLLLALIGVITAAIGAYYYLRIVVKMYLWPADGPAPICRAAWPTLTAVGVCAVFSLVFGLYPSPIDVAAREATIASVAQPDPAIAPTRRIASTAPVSAR